MISYGALAQNKTYSHPLCTYCVMAQAVYHLLMEPHFAHASSRLKQPYRCYPALFVLINAMRFAHTVPLQTALLKLKLSLASIRHITFSCNNLIAYGCDPAFFSPCPAAQTKQAYC